ncbi:Hypothetical protein SMAX5B_011544 [Scophthalmus maximus]|uniref:Uncharacterized protein n=1 Tax=Scophthalmus maximus TaxID=52904 RepID=A0A2U9BM88_SCOMX|nr:Hypothetical protein SMAX5B_011544 [Scophthalmus maximus]
MKRGPQCVAYLKILASGGYEAERAEAPLGDDGRHRNGKTRRRHLGSTNSSPDGDRTTRSHSVRSGSKSTQRRRKNPPWAGGKVRGKASQAAFSSNAEKISDSNSPCVGSLSRQEQRHR